MITKEEYICKLINVQNRLGETMSILDTFRACLENDRYSIDDVPESIDRELEAMSEDIKRFMNS